ncbi:hypothetical protein HUJ04_011409 [Dendroctonus ponderosae]|nr:hypothetical protein HUJ04_011409 [Dendroctonus ponderosae]KAH1028588.1 hypothetical protein HUJ05_001929 [Dendroctonus ponderosae]
MDAIRRSMRISRRDIIRNGHINQQMGIGGSQEKYCIDNQPREENEEDQDWNSRKPYKSP